VASVERPLQHLCTGVAATGQHDADHVQLVVVGGLNSVHAQARQGVPQLGIRQAGPDDRAVQRLGKLQILLRLSGCGDAASEGACARNRTSVRRSSLISGGSAVPARKLVGMGGSSDTILARYICSNIASMERPRWKGVIRGRPRIGSIDMFGGI